MIRYPKSTQGKPLRVLIVEDSEEFASSLTGHLRHAGYDLTFARVETEAAVRDALERQAWDLILSDYVMPSFDGMAALRLCKEQAPEVPFILLSGSIGEDLAVEALHAGADDYILKTNPARLLPAIERALREAGRRRELLCAGEALRASEAYARMLIDSSLDMIVAVDVERRITEFNRAAEEAFGYQRDDVVGEHVDLLYADPGESAAVHEAVVQDGRCVREILNRRNDGGVFPSFLSASVMRDAGGAVVGYMGVSRDLSKRKQREAELAHALSRLQAIFEATTDGILVTDLDGACTNYNRRLLELWRFSESVVTGPVEARLAAVQAHLKDPRDFVAKVLALRAQPETESFDLLEFKDGRIVERYSRPQQLGGKSVGRVWIFRDVTERRRMEEQMRQMQKMETVGLLAGGIAHDFNNILTVIQGHASLLQMTRRPAADAAGAVREIVRAAELAASLTNQLLTFGRRKAMQLTPLDVNAVVGGTAQMLRRLLGEQIALRVECAAALPVVGADADMLEQVLLNLAVNARDAMPAGGELLIRTAAVTVDDASAARNPAARPGPCVSVSVQDTGCGIAPEHRPHLFEPFFTTKPAGKGTGLGLSTVYGIVKQHQGWIEVQSEPGNGTTFRIFLPCQEQAAQPSDARPDVRRIRGGSETVLVVEDEAPVRELVRHMLEHLGYTVRMAASGVEALEVWNEHRQRIDLLMTDVVMPEGMTGQELAERLRAEKRRSR